MATSHEQSKQALAEFVQKYLPAARALEIGVRSYDGETLELCAPLERNINDKMTAFGGSLYMISVMCAWGSVYLKCLEHGIPNPDIVVGHAEIDYILPVKDAVITAACSVSTADFEEFFAKFNQRGKASIAIEASVHTQGQQAVSFKARYAILGYINAE